MMETMRFVFNEQKTHALGYTLEAIYAVLDRLFASYGVSKVSEGIYTGDDSQDAYTAFGVAQRLPDDTDWFLQVIDKWEAWDDDGEPEDCLEVYYRIKARNA